MTALFGTVIRPSTSQRVAWHLAPSLAREASIAEALGYTVYSIGNEAHLRLNGGHTPWRGGVYDGVVKAIDVMLDDKGIADDFERWLVPYLKSPVDTRWILFLNINGHQYDSGGNLLDSSADFHLHLEITDAAQDTPTHMFADWRDRNKKPPTKGKAVYLVKVSGDAHVWLADLIWRRLVADDRELNALKTLLGKDVETVTNLNHYGKDLAHNG